MMVMATRNSPLHEMRRPIAPFTGFAARRRLKICQGMPFTTFRRPSGANRLHYPPAPLA
jgi:hypothetical protein